MEKSSYPSDALDRYIVRFPDGIRDRLKEQAQANNRTLNAEIVARLVESLDRPAPQDLDVFALVSEINKGVSQTVTKAGFTIELKVTPAFTTNYDELLSRAISDEAKKK